MGSIFLSLPGLGTGQQVNLDSAFVTRIIKTTIRGASGSFSISFATGVAQLQSVQASSISAVQGSFSQTLFASSITTNTLSTTNFQICSVSGATPVFGDGDGQLMRGSPLLPYSINSAGFTPERISPIENGVQAKFNGQVKSFSDGQTEMFSISKSTYRLVAPLSLALNQESANIRILSIKICVLDNNNSLDLVAIVHEVKDSQNSPVLLFTPRFGVRSSDHINEYRCFDDIKSTTGTDFVMDQSSNSYYISVFPIVQTLPTDDVFKASPAPVTLDNPSLRLVHVTVRYIHE